LGCAFVVGRRPSKIAKWIINELSLLAWTDSLAGRNVGALPNGTVFLFPGSRRKSFFGRLLTILDQVFSAEPERNRTIALRA
jgi:hypothetical protein